MIRLTTILIALLISAVFAPLAEAQIIPMPKRDRIFVDPETVGVEKDSPFPAVKDRIHFQCPECMLTMSTQVLYPHLPHCPKDSCVMLEIFHREHWLGEKGIEFLYDKNLKQWKKKQTGELFDETDNTTRYVELSDSERKVAIRLYDNRATYREDYDGKWMRLQGGKWSSTK
jgi:hypothetical protein